MDLKRAWGFRARGAPQLPGPGMQYPQRRTISMGHYKIRYHGREGSQRPVEVVEVRLGGGLKRRTLNP